ncbi:MAG: RibD family protein [Chloroflexi bacterium]|nr:RibD family protein [Chloroflexota bacterium]
MLPEIILHNGISVDGRMDWFTGDIGLYYELAMRWQIDAMLSGSNTMLAAPEQSPDQPGETFEVKQDPNDSRPLAVVVDSRGRIHNWNFWRKQPYWRNLVVLCSRSTPQSYLDELRGKQVDYIVAGDNHVDLRAALEELNERYGVKTIRVDSGGVLNGVLLRAGLVKQVSVLINPTLVGGTSPRSIFTAPDLTSAEGILPLKLIHVENVRDDVVWLKYEVVK